jgi:WXG100 family type VII secretion target
MPDVKMNYQQMEQMARTCEKAARSIEDSYSAIDGVMGKLQEAFQGMGGDAMQEAVKQTLAKKMNTMRDKMGEMSKDLAKAADETKKGIKDSKSKYM